MGQRRWISIWVMAVAIGCLGGCAATWGQQGHVEAFAKERPAGTCHGTFSGGLTSTFFCTPVIKPSSTGGFSLMMSNGMMGLVPQNDIDPAGNVRDLLLLVGVKTGAAEARTYTSPELEMGSFITSPPKTEWNQWGVTKPVFSHPNAVAPPLSPDFHATLVLTSADPAAPHGTLELTLIEATQEGAGPGRAKLHIDF